MTIRTFTSREFNQDVSAATKASQDEPVVITDRSRPTHVLLSMPAAADIELEPPKVNFELKPADFS